MSTLWWVSAFTAVALLGPIGIILIWYDLRNQTHANAG